MDLLKKIFPDDMINIIMKDVDISKIHFLFGEEESKKVLYNRIKSINFSKYHNTYPEIDFDDFLEHNIIPDKDLTIGKIKNTIYLSFIPKGSQHHISVTTNINDYRWLDFVYSKSST